jgi:hypothetical protein
VTLKLAPGAANDYRYGKHDEALDGQNGTVLPRDGLNGGCRARQAAVPLVRAAGSGRLRTRDPPFAGDMSLSYGREAPGGVVPRRTERGRRMSENWQDRAVTWPVRRLFVVVLVLTGAVGLPVWWWADPGAPGLARVGIGLSFAVFFSAFMSVGVHLARRRQTAVVGELPPAALIDVQHALRIGGVPRDPALDGTTLALIDRRRTQTRKSLRLSSPLWGLALVLWSAAVVIEPTVTHVLRVAFYVALAVLAFVAQRRQVARLNRAERAIRARAGGGA